MAKNFSNASHRDNLCAASQNCYTPLPHDIVVFVIFLFSISLKTTPVTVGAVQSSYVFRFFGFKP